MGRRDTDVLYRHCEARSGEAIQAGARGTGLLRYARNDGLDFGPVAYFSSVPFAACSITSRASSVAGNS